MEIEGTIYKILPRELVTFGDGTQKAKGGFVISCNIDYPHYVAFELFGEERLVMLEGLSAGMLVRVNFYAESRESKNGNFYTALKCFGITTLPIGQNVVGTEPQVAHPAVKSGSSASMDTGDKQQESSQQTTSWLMGGDEEVPF